jgi:UPF0042 nucleotide-binding protein
VTRRSDHRSDDKAAARVVFVTGASGAGRTTAINVLEDLGYETINNLPLSLLERVLDGPSGTPPLALGIDVRNRDFSQDKVLAALDRLSEDDELDAEILFLDSRTDVLVRRYSETRRKHPLAPSETPEVGIAREMDLLVPIRARADHVIDTSDMTPHQLRAEIERLFSASGSLHLSLSVESFSFKRGLPRGVDMVFDVRFLANPHWEERLRGLNGRDAAVAAYVEADPRFADFFERISGLVFSLLPAFKEEGKTYLAIGLGCTGGQHRSVAVAEKLAKTLAEHGWQVSTRHREMERRGSGAPRGTG